LSLLRRIDSDQLLGLHEPSTSSDGKEAGSCERGAVHRVTVRHDTCTEKEAPDECESEAGARLEHGARGRRWRDGSNALSKTLIRLDATLLRERELGRADLRLGLKADASVLDGREGVEGAEDGGSVLGVAAWLLSLCEERSAQGRNAS
jgi:hypothetical protein